MQPVFTATLKCDAVWLRLAIFSRPTGRALAVALGTVSAPLWNRGQPLKENCGVRLNIKVKHCRALDLI